MKFDPPQHQEYLKELLLPRARKKDFAEALDLRLLYSFGVSILGCCIDCFLVGLFDDGRELLPKARSFLRAAVEY